MDTTIKPFRYQHQIQLSMNSSIRNYANDDIWLLEEVLTDITLGSVNGIEWLLNSYQRYCDINGEARYLMAKHILESIYEFSCSLLTNRDVSGKQWYIYNINVNPEYDVIHYVVELR